ncbi:MAG: DUF2752 domain-containing protein [Chlorobi bacterium]|nr:DUF2752 domain-containing protein [Chlorobiota bacterium]
MNNSFKLKYLGIIIFFISGYFFLFYTPSTIDNHTICIFKSVTAVPCPSCGSTRSVIELLQGNIQTSLLINPLGIITTILIFLSILWMAADIIRSKDTFLPSLKKNISNKYKIMLLIIILANWAWNIQKGL